MSISGHKPLTLVRYTKYTTAQYFFLLASPNPRYTPKQLLHDVDIYSEEW
jgi:hypothetical protein